MDYTYIMFVIWTYTNHELCGLDETTMWQTIIGLGFKCYLFLTTGLII